MTWLSSLPHFFRSIRRHQGPALLLLPRPDSPGRDNRKQESSRWGWGQAEDIQALPLFLGYKAPSSSFAEPPRNPQESHRCVSVASGLSFLLPSPRHTHTQFLRSWTATGRSCHRTLRSPECPLEKPGIPGPAPMLVDSRAPSMEFAA